MAVNINEVYKRVLAIANKEQRGHITPLEFNNLATQVQLEIFEQYFYDINLQSRKPGNSTEFSDHLKILEEKIAPFRVNDQTLFSETELSPTSTFESGTIGNWNDQSGNNSTPVVVTNANNGYVPSLKIIKDGTDASPHVDDTVSLTMGKKFRLSVEVSYAVDPDANDSLGIGLRAKHEDAATDGYYEVITTATAGQTVTLDFTTIDVSNVGAGVADNYVIRVGLDPTQSAGTADLSELHISKISIKEIDNKTLASDVHKLGGVTSQRTGVDSYPIPVDEVDKKEMTLFNLSPLARPTSSNPAYFRASDTSISIFPEPTSGTDIKYSYIKKPSTPKWAYTTVLNPGNNVQQQNPTNEYKPQWSPSNSVNFELHASEETKIVMKILELAGVVNKEADIVQYADKKNTENFQKQTI